MAKKNSTNKKPLRFYVNGQQKSIYGLSAREGERLKDKIDALKVAQLAGEFTPALQLWVNDLESNNPDLYDRLAGYGLLPERQHTRTLKDLIREYRQRSDIEEGTRKTVDAIGNNLVDFFGTNKTIDAITQEEAQKFGRWLQTARLNRKGARSFPYSESTVKKRITKIKGMFIYAEKLGWIQQNPFRFLKGGTAVNPEKMEYVDLERFNRVLEEAPLYWKLILMFGRLCGVRGSSELYRMELEDIHLSTADRPGVVLVRSCKTQKYRKLRTVPIPPVMEPVLVQWLEQLPVGETLVFPNMKKETNFSTMTKKLAIRAGVVPWRNPWYNLRKSFCTDLLQAVSDTTVYEHISDHSAKVSQRHYQILNQDRLDKGIKAALSCFPENKAKEGENPILKSILTRYSKPYLQRDAKTRRFAEQLSQVLEKQASFRLMWTGCNNSQSGQIAREGFEPPTKGL